MARYLGLGQLPVMCARLFCLLSVFNKRTNLLIFVIFQIQQGKDKAAVKKTKTQEKLSLFRIYCLKFAP